jgi:hypothetical protein
MLFAPNPSSFAGQALKGGLLGNEMEYSIFDLKWPLIILGKATVLRLAAKALSKQYCLSEASCIA